MKNHAIRAVLHMRQSRTLRRLTLKGLTSCAIDRDTAVATIRQTLLKPKQALGAAPAI